MQDTIDRIKPDLMAWRHDLHTYPELGYQEVRTAGKIADLLRAFGCDAVDTGIGGTGVVGTIRANASDKAIMLRADMDALPIVEETGVGHASQHTGVMHACGHDGHTTMLLGAAKILAETRDFTGTVYVCFQPAEEGGAGAKAMMDDGLFTRFPCDYAFGMHNWPRIPAGTFAVLPGAIMASADEFTISIQGSGGHAAKPDKTCDPIVVGAYLVTALQTIAARQTDPFSPLVLSVTQFHAGSTFNVIPDTAMLQGTVRSFDAQLHADTYAAIQRTCDSVGALFGAQISLTRSEHCYPPTVNDAALTQHCLSVLNNNGHAVQTDCSPSMGAEDFSYYCQEKPGCFVFLGNGDSYPLHHPKFDFNDDILTTGVKYWVDLAQATLR